MIQGDGDGRRGARTQVAPSTPSNADEQPTRRHPPDLCPHSLPPCPHSPPPARAAPSPARAASPLPAAQRSHTLFGQLVQLVKQARQVHDDAVADHVLGVRVQEAARDEVEVELLVAHHDRVPGVVSALGRTRPPPPCGRKRVSGA